MKETTQLILPGLSPVIKTKVVAANDDSFSTATGSQRERIITALLTGPKTSYDLRRLGCYQAPARIKELRDRFGYDIETIRVTLIDRDGYAHPNAALYTLRVPTAASKATEATEVQS